MIFLKSIRLILAKTVIKNHKKNNTGFKERLQDRQKKK